MKDFKDVIIQLYVQLGEETGPFRKRGAYKQWVRWVELAGGSVRGSSKKGATEQAKVQAARKRRGSLKVSGLSSAGGVLPSSIAPSAGGRSNRRRRGSVAMSLPAKVIAFYLPVHFMRILLTI